MYIIDRRLNPKGKSIANTQRFFDRVKNQIRNSIDQTIKHSTIKDVTDDVGVSSKNVIAVDKNTIHEPHFHFDNNKGLFSFVLPGNKHHENDFLEYHPPPPTQKGNLLTYKENDRIYKPEGAPSSRGGGLGDGIDDFLFILSPEEYAKLLLDDLDLPFQEERLRDTSAITLQRAGYTMTGTPANLSLPKTLTNSMGRRISLRRPKLDEIEDLEQQLQSPNLSVEKRNEILLAIEEMKSRMEIIPYIDPFDVRYTNFIPDPKPKFKAVMFCLMDCSGSMGEHEKDLAKRFYVILYRFLKLKHDKVEVVFIRHTDRAKIVDEDTFFYSQESGGTVVSTAFEAMLQEIKRAYNPAEWNIYVAQASDGDNWYPDQEKTKMLVEDQVLPLVNYFTYLETIQNPENPYGGFTRHGASALWDLYSNIVKTHKKMAIKQVSHRKEIYPIFRDLFAKKD